MNSKKKIPIQKTLIIVTGGPGTGKSKTTEKLVDYISDEYIVQISYDNIKEKNWDRFGFDNINEKTRLDNWSLEEFYLTLRKYMWEGKMIIVEYPFSQKHRSRFLELIEEYAYNAITICLYTDFLTEYKRSVQRDSKGNRHPGHFLDSYHIQTFRANDLERKARSSYEKFVEQIKDRNYKISLGLQICVDVTDFSCINYDEICSKITNYELT